MEHYNPHNKDQHFFVTTAFGWVADPNLAEALRRVRTYTPKTKGRKSAPTRAVVFHVPLAPGEQYEINYFTPQVEGIVKIWEGDI